ncbi:MAG: hypothetical protein F6K58_21520 [Symploca sp. SIO2E9]|nr:hypothetical protein [Symploca sp. SIO2E9]
MTQATYQTRVPDNLIAFCEEMGLLFGHAERRLYVDLRSGKKLNALKKEYQVTYGINARQFNSIHSSIKGKIASRNQCLKRQINELKSRISDLKKSLEKKVKKFQKVAPSCGVGKQRSSKAQLRFEIDQKRQKLARLEAKLERIKDVIHAPVIFGSRKLWKAQHNLEENGYTNHEEWLADWRAARSSQFMLVGSKDEPNGNRNCQLEPDGTLKVAVPYSLSTKYGERLKGTKTNYLSTTGISFKYGQGDVEYALAKGQALTFRFAKKNGIWYLFVTVELLEVPYQSHRRNGMIGVDLNPGVIGWAYCDGEGNLKAKGQIKVNLQDKSSDQTEAILGSACAELVILANTFKCPICIEKL